MAKPIILCVDDEKIVLDSLKKELQPAFKEMLNVEIAESGEEALEIIEEELKDGNDIPLIISDFIMPEMKGDEFLIRSKKLSPNSKRIMLTGQANKEGVGNAVINAGLYRFIEKPWDSLDLELTVMEAFKSFYKEKKLDIKESQLENLNRTLEAKYEKKTREVEQKNEKIKDILDKTVKGIIYSLVTMISKSEDQFLSKSIRLRDLSKKIAGELYPEQVWEVEIAALLSHLGCMNMDIDLKKRYFTGDILSQAESIRVRDHIKSSASLLERIPLFENISRGISNIFYTTDNINSDANAHNISTISRIIRIVNDYDNMILSGKDKESTIAHMKNNTRFYDYQVFKSFEELVFATQDVDIEKAVIRAKDVKIGMKLADDVTDLQGNIIVPKNDEINQASIAIITRLHRKNEIVEPIYIIKSEANN